MNETNYVVYRHTSPSSKVYIGITCQIPENRWNNGKGYKNQILFYRSIQKYGWNNFKHEILYSGLNEISAKLIEEDLIYYYKKQNISYNITDGGDGTKGYKHTEETKKKIGKKSREANLGKHHLSEEAKKEISKRMKINNPTKNGLSEKWRNNISKAFSKSVSQYSIDGKLIATYSSINEASKSIKRDAGNISKCCNGKQKTAGGYIWKFNKN